MYLAKRMLGKRATPNDFDDTMTSAFVRKSQIEAEAEELQQVGDCFSETGDSQQAFHDEPCLSELVRTLSSSSLSSEDTTAYGWSKTCSSFLDSVVDTTAYGSSVARTSCSIRFSGKDRAGIAHNAMGSRGELDRDFKTNPNEQYKMK